MRRDWGNVSFWYISELGVQMFMKLWYLTLFLVAGCVAQSLGECLWSLGDCVFLICAVLV